MSEERKKLTVPDLLARKKEGKRVFIISVPYPSPYPLTALIRFLCLVGKHVMTRKRFCEEDDLAI